MFRSLTKCAQQCCKKIQLLKIEAVNVEQARTTVIVKRKYEIPLTKEGRQPRPKHRHQVYDLIRNENLTKVPEIKVILQEYVEGIGDRGDVVDVKAAIVRWKLLPAKQAVYASPENLAELERQKKESGLEDRPKLSPFTVKSIRMLKGMTLIIPMNAEIPWILNKSHVRIAFRTLGVEVPEDVITMPEGPITKPSDKFQVGVTMNNLETFQINAIIEPLYKDPEKGSQFVRPPVWQAVSIRKLKKRAMLEKKDTE